MEILWWTVGNTGTNYNEFELFKFIGIIVNVVKFMKNYVLLGKRVVHSALNSFIFRKNVYTVLLRPKLNIYVFGHFTEGLALFTQSVLSLPNHIKQSQFLFNTLQPDSWYLCTNVIGRRAPPGVMFITKALSP